jgi:hypothetical protein
MKILVCGSRHFNDYELLERILNEYEISDIIHGDARGADRLAGQYGNKNEIPVHVFPAQWDLYGKGAGHIRNGQMLREGTPELVIAFRGPNSRGTQNMIDQATKAGVETRIIEI